MLFSLVSPLMSRSGGTERAGILFTRHLGVSPGSGSAWLRVLRQQWLSSSRTELSLPVSVSEAPHSPPALGPLPFFWACHPLGPMTSCPGGLWVLSSCPQNCSRRWKGPWIPKSETRAEWGALASPWPLWCPQLTQGLLH